MWIDGKVLAFDERGVIGGGGGGGSGCGVAEVALGVEDAELSIGVQTTRVWEVRERFGREDGGADQGGGPGRDGWGWASIDGGG